MEIPQLTARYGRPVTWLGQVHTVDVLLNGPPEHVRTATIELLEAMGRRGRFILSPGCEPSILTPEKHVAALVAAVREFNARTPRNAGHPSTAPASGEEER